MYNHFSRVREDLKCGVRSYRLNIAYRYFRFVLSLSGLVQHSDSLGTASQHYSLYITQMKCTVPVTTCINTRKYDMHWKWKLTFHHREREARRPCQLPCVNRTWQENRSGTEGRGKDEGRKDHHFQPSPIPSIRQRTELNIKLCKSHTSEF